MSSRLRQYLLDVYEPRGMRTGFAGAGDVPIQIDDQDDSDNIDEFCTIFVQVTRNNMLVVELEGRMPITPDIADLAEIYGGSADPQRAYVVLRITLQQADALEDLAARIKQTQYDGDKVSNPNWFKIAARTASSLKRFVRLIRDYR